MNFRNPNVKRAIFLIIAVGLSVILLRQLQGSQKPDPAPSVPYSDFVQMVRSDLVEKVKITPATGEILATLQPGAETALELDAIIDTASTPSAASKPAPAIDKRLINIDPPALTPPPGETKADPTQPKNLEEVVLPTPAAPTVALGASRQISTVAPPMAIDTVMELLQTESPGTVIEVGAPARPSTWGGIAYYTILLLPILLLGLIFWFSRRAGGPGGQADRAANFGKIRSAMVDPDSNPVRLADVAGCDEAKLEVAEIVDFLKRPEDFTRVGAKGPRGVLMVGSPGTGKTLLAKAIAGEAGVPFFTQSGSDFVEMFVGVGASRVRSLFELVKQHAPAIVFIDEIDAVGKTRSNGNVPGSNDERETTLNELLVQMDGFQSNSGIVVIAATNRADVLDPALRRPGRFDREVVVPLPDRDGRAKILALHAKKVPVARDVDWQKVARGTPGFSGADLANLVNEAALHAARRRASMVTPQDLEDARDKIIMGTERKGTVMNERDRRVVAYHEAGHALVGHFLPHTDPVHKITIVPRGRALGVTMSLPDEDSYNHNSDRLRAEIAVLMGGRAAEDVALSNASVGASNDFHRATALARRMVGVWGMSELGTISVHGEQGEGGGWSVSPWSEHWKRQVDDTSAAILHEEYNRAKQVMVDHREALERVALALLEHETVDSDLFLKLIAGSVESIVVADASETSASIASASDTTEAPTDPA